VGQPKRYSTLPPLSGRTLPNLDIINDGASLKDSARHSPGVLEVQKGYDWSGNGQLFFMPAGDQPVLEVEFPVQSEEYRGLILRCTYAEDYGIYRIFLDGKNVRQPDDYMAGQKLQDFDFYSKDLAVKDIYLGSYKLPKGMHKIRLEYVGKNPLSKGNYLGLDSIRLRERWEKKRKNLQ